jgi:hypothetical protein
VMVEVVRVLHRSIASKHVVPRYSGESVPDVVRILT